MVDADHLAPARQFGGTFDGKPGAEADLEHLVRWLDVEERQRAQVALAI